jgi:hypothetical protein
VFDDAYAQLHSLGTHAHVACSRVEAINPAALQQHKRSGCQYVHSVLAGAAQAQRGASQSFPVDSILRKNLHRNCHRRCTQLV